MCLSWRNVSTELLFDRIFFSARQHDVDVADAWSKNIRCRAATKELVYDVTYLDLNLDFSDYANILWHYLDYRVAEFGFGTSWSDEEQARYMKCPIAQNGYSKYREEASRQDEIHGGDELSMRLAFILERMPNITRLKISDKSHFFPERIAFDPVTLQPFTGSPFRRTWHFKYLPPLSRATFLKYLGTTRYPHGFEEKTVFAFQHNALVRAIALAGKSISRMTIEADMLNEDLELSQKKFPGYAAWENTRLCNQIKHVYSGIRAFELKVPINVNEDFGFEEDAHHSIQACLEFSSKLTELSIDASVDHLRQWRDRDAAEKALYDKIFSDIPTFLCLKRVILVSLSFNRRSLESFLTEHRQLQSLELLDCSLVGCLDVRADFLSFCQSINHIPRLRVVRMVGYISSDFWTPEPHVALQTFNMHTGGSS